uniref:Uncharacterized protein n=1 Tax=Sus scrofa TaxID=9823 RepID=A0A8D0ZIX4_PIG
TYSVTVLEARSPTSRCQQSHVPSESSREVLSFLASPSFPYGCEESSAYSSTSPLSPTLSWTICHFVALNQPNTHWIFGK